jgi:hypothetical protein
MIPNTERGSEGDRTNFSVTEPPLGGIAMRLDRRGATYLAVSERNLWRVAYIPSRERCYRVNSASSLVSDHFARTVTLIVTHSRV